MSNLNTENETILHTKYSIQKGLCLYILIILYSLDEEGVIEPLFINTFDSGTKIVNKVL